ncbi:MAG: hypothetical protein H8E67_01555 [Proteobacteria bacterium]|jgi:class 3 adenylate cyclase|nr:hypothetical protein [Pseudomonadota bacterium]MBT5793500.1 hypothetical protein [Deltaproteobacteria bacterium]
MSGLNTCKICLSIQAIRFYEGVPLISSIVIFSGTVIAGNTFVIWRDVVNVAARLESCRVRGKIHISEISKDYLFIT